MPRTLLLVLLGLAAGGCGTTEQPVRRTEVTDADRSRARTALELLRGRYPGLTINEAGGGLEILLRGRAPVLVVDGTRTPFAGRTADLSPSEVVEIEVLTSMSDTLIYGADAAEVGVVRITTVLGGRDPRQ